MGIVRAPAFQHYAADFLANRIVTLMTAEEVGAYWLLVNYCWREGNLPDDIEELASLSRVPFERFQASWDKRISRLFEKQESTWIHPGLEEERQKQADNREKKRAAANKRHHPEDAQAMHKQCTSNAGAEQVQCPSSSTSSAYSDTNVSGADAPKPSSDSKPLNTIWDLGVPLLTNGGMKNADARSLLGKMAKDYSRAVLAEAIARTSAANPPDPKAYLVKVLQDNGKPKERGMVL